MHWAVAIPFMVCWATALILVFVYNPDPGRPFRQLVSWTHRISGLCLFALPAWTFLRHWRHAKLHLHNVRQVWRWSWADVRWLFLIAPASLSRRITLPWQGKFNAGEKINFAILSSTYPIYLCTGLLIWFDESPFLSWLVHFALAVVATPLLFGHICMATLLPDTRPGLRGMITGFVDRAWARHHYRLWYLEHYETRRPVAAAARSAPAPRAAAELRREAAVPEASSPRRDRSVQPAPPSTWPEGA